MKRLWIGWGFAAVAGLLLAIGSLQVRSMPECGFLSFSPLCGQLEESFERCWLRQH